ncbi:hypothetical protein BT63DRAFT_254032 [Microthyrium microscopicum]|uniref:Uncharacterized protein n=1 Tax=Microthyrium microscopicum TaxID=703497 RepID=A0A6A6UAC5_9PEZI|nr:hypothetical protein BT63DRAFT_254032 [Microthyrium microscopicum]
MLLCPSISVPAANELSYHDQPVSVPSLYMLFLVFTLATCSSQPMRLLENSGILLVKSLKLLRPMYEFKGPHVGLYSISHVWRKTAFHYSFRMFGYPLARLAHGGPHGKTSSATRSTSSRTMGITTKTESCAGK